MMNLIPTICSVICCACACFNAYLVHKKAKENLALRAANNQLAEALKNSAQVIERLQNELDAAAQEVKHGQESKETADQA